MNTEQEIKSIQVNLDRLYSELNGIRAMVQHLLQQPDGIIGNSSDSPYAVETDIPDPNPYQVDWSNAPEWADVHCWDASNFGYWYGTIEGRSSWIPNLQLSGYNLAAGLDWKLSKTYRPR